MAIGASEVTVFLVTTGVSLSAIVSVTIGISKVEVLNAEEKIKGFRKQSKKEIL